MASRKILQLVRLARGGEAAAQRELAALYLQGGEGLGKNLKAAAGWLLRAAAQGDAAAAGLLGDHVPPQDIESPKEAMPYLEQAAEAGSRQAAVTLAGWWMDGTFGPPAPEAARRWLKPAAAAGYAPAQVAMAALGNAADETENPLALLEAAARQGEQTAMARLTAHYWQSGQCDLWQAGQVAGEPPSRWPQAEASARALSWHARRWPASADGNGEEDYRRGVLLLHARQPGALPWLESAAALGVARASYLLGLLHMGPAMVPALAQGGRGAKIGVPRSYKKAGRHLEMAAAHGLPEAEMALSILYRQRGFAQRDPASALRHLEKAANLGHAEAQFRLGMALKKGEGDDLAAARWLLRASEQGHGEAAKRYRQLVAVVDQNAPWVTARLETARAVTGIHLALGLRLELAARFGLCRHELLLIDMREADCGDYLLVDLRHAYKKCRRRLVEISHDEQKALLRRARGVLGAAGVGDVSGEYGFRVRQFKYFCQRHQVPIALFDAAAEENSGAADGGAPSSGANHALPNHLSLADS